MPIDRDNTGRFISNVQQATSRALDRMLKVWVDEIKTLLDTQRPFNTTPHDHAGEPPYRVSGDLQASYKTKIINNSGEVDGLIWSDTREFADGFNYSAIQEWGNGIVDAHPHLRPIVNKHKANFNQEFNVYFQQEMLSLSME